MKPTEPGFSPHAGYLGDGVYANFDGFGIVLTTEDGVSETNRIVLEPKVYECFVRWHERLIYNLRRIRAHEATRASNTPPTTEAH